jgi:ATP-dependent Clp protease ATP-binding subunit ClpA
MTRRAVLDLNRKDNRARAFEQKLAQRVVGQDEAVQALTDLYQVFLADMLPPQRPVGTLLFLGPTGAGKTRTVEAVAEALFGNSQALIKIDCAEFQHAHEIARLIGSPPGYVGHRESPPLLTQEHLDRHQTADTKLTLLLFDEIEKASDALWHLLLGILDRATLTLGDNRTVDFSRAIVVMTSNLGAHEMSDIMSGGLGFSPAREESPKADERLRRDIQRAGVEAARRRFSPEFMNRIDKTIVFTPLGPGELREVLDLELQAVQRRLHKQKGPRFRFECSEDVRDLLLKEGTDVRYGARPLKRAIERRIVVPLAGLIASNQVGSGDLVEIDVDRDTGQLIFTRTADVVAVPEIAPAAAMDDEPSRTVLEREAAQLAITTAIAITAAVVDLIDSPAARRSRI